MLLGFESIGGLGAGDLGHSSVFMQPCAVWENVRAKMRIAVKKILQRHGYPPDMTADAVKTVLKQAEALAAAMS